MLRGIYAPTDFESLDRAPRFSPTEKLDIIARSPVTIHPKKIRGVVYEDSFLTRLPFVDGAIFDFGISRLEEVVMTNFINIGDSALYGHGLGSRLLRASVRYSVERDKRVAVFDTGWARLGLVNAAIGVFGAENTAVILAHERYGWGSSRPLDAIFDDSPPEPDKKYLVNSIEARIDRDLAMTWEEPVVLEPRLSA